MLFDRFLSPELAEQVSFICSFVLVTSLFILFADLTPKRIGMIAPETVAVRIINPMRFSIMIFRPLVWFFNGMANLIFRMFKLPMVRKDDITSDDIYAVVEAGALAGVLRKQEHELIENVFELESRTVPSSDDLARKRGVLRSARKRREHQGEGLDPSAFQVPGVRRP
ncbi:Putative Mg2+ and Co2+ transporter CorB [Serratia marcescens]|uniref:Mg2+ and Co2+ transporter CorB n=1 Tax=Serratia marcescens TaxID=615 RepID=A0A379Y366_SERMA|nr:Putative Mg2+ and Co2+ transporter CorB [Serratia marcescens]